MKIIAGLGNPGKEYEKTRHNIGFQILDIFQEKLEFPAFRLKSKFNAEISEGEINSEKILLVKPQTYMNLSGIAIRKLIKFYNLDPGDLWVVVDDLDFALGDFKIKSKGGPGSHNGLISIRDNIQSDNYPRLRIGIESRNEKLKSEFKGRNYVLSVFSASEEKIMAKTRKKACEALIFAVEKGIQAAMNKYN